MAQTIKKSLGVLLVILMFVNVLAPISVFAEDNVETLDFTNDYSEWGPKAITQYHFTITPYGAEDILALGYWEFDPDYTGCYAVITGLYGETITKLVIHYEEDYLPPEIKVNGKKVNGSAEGGAMTYENLNASSVRVGPVEEYEEWDTVDIYSIDVYFTGGNAPKASDATIELIDAIGTVEYTNASKAKIDAAREAYDKLSAADKAEVTNYDVLTAAEATYQNFVDHDRANRVITAIDNLGAVEYNPAYKIKLMNARNAYNGLSNVQKALVTNYEILTAAEDDFNANSTIVNAGSFGGLYWMLDRDGVLTFTGSGEIPMSAFKNNSSIRKIIFNKSVTVIRSAAFEDCHNLTEVVFENNVSVFNILFFDCNNLAKVTLPEGFSRIGPYMFEGCSALTSIDIPASVGSIDIEVFRGTSIKTVVFRHGVSHNAGSFDGMGQLETLVIASEAPINYTSGEFTGLGANTKVYVPVGSTFKVPGSTGYELYVKDAYIDDYDPVDFEDACETFYSSMNIFGNSAAEAFQEVQENGNAYEKYAYRQVTVSAVDVELTDNSNQTKLFGNATIFTYVVPTEAINLFKSVAAIEDITECKAKIAEAKDAYNALTDIQKMAVKYSYKNVTDKEADINFREAPANVAAQINALPTDVTFDNKAEVEAARAAYDALTDEQKALVDESALNALIAAETAIANQETAAAVAELINALPADVTLDNQAEVEAARAAYDALTDEQKALVDESALNALIAAEAAIANTAVGTIVDGVYYEEGERVHKGLIKIDGDYYYIASGGIMAADMVKWVGPAWTNGLLPAGLYVFDETGKMIPTVKNGIVNGRYYVNDVPVHAGLIEIDGDYYYIASGGVVATGTKWVGPAWTNDLLPAGTYMFDADGRMIPTVKNGIVNGRYYVNGVETHAGLIEVDGDYYYIASGGVVATGTKWVGPAWTNGLVPAGTYTFDETGRMVRDV